MTGHEPLAAWWVAAEPFLHRASRRYSITVQAREDLIQDVAVLALRQPPSRWPSAEEFRRWALARLHWLMLDYVMAARQSRLMPLAPERVVPHAAEQESRVVAIDLLGLIARLPPRQAIVLSGLAAGRSAEELAAALEVSPATIRSLARFARQRLVLLIRAEEEGG